MGLPLCKGLSYHLEILDDGIERELYHSATMVPVRPLRAHSSAIRFSAARFTSKECLKRANASSYETFLITIYFDSLVSGRKGRHKSQISKEKSKN